MSKAPAFQLYASDFYMDTTGWTVAQVGIYLRLLMSEWVNGYIPNDTERLARIAQIDHGNFLKCYHPTIEGKFFPNGDGNLINRRLEEVRQKQSKYIESQILKGRHGAEKRWEDKMAPAIPSAITQAQPNDSSSSSSSLLKNNNRNLENGTSIAKPKRWYKNDQGNYVCYQCQKSFMQYNKLQDHLTSHQGA